MPTAPDLVSAVWRELQPFLAYGRALVARRAGAPQAPPRVRDLLESIGAGPAGEEILAVCLAVELDPATREQLGPRLTLTVATLLAAVGPERGPALLVELADDGPLCSYRLVEVELRRGEPFAAAAVRASPRLVRWLLDPLDLREEVRALARLRRLSLRPALPPSALAALGPLIDGITAFLAGQESADGDGPRHLILRGPRGSGRREVAREASRRLGRPLLEASAHAVLGQADPALACVTLLREAVLTGAQLFVDEADALEGRALHTLATSARPVILASSAETPPACGALLREVPPLAPAARAAMWREVLDEVDADGAAALRLGAGGILRVAARARAAAAVGGRRAAHADIIDGVSAELETDLGTVARKITPSQRWDDLVLPEDTRGSIDELIGQIRHRATVLGRWGFQEKLGRGVGTVALFSGAPGTGKTMVAGLVARELGLDLYQVDLSRIASKWIGETEKNLARLFDAAEVGHALLLIDEADALVTRRQSEPRSGNDRNANLETNFILARLESFGGVAILTTNLDGALDPALSRRLSLELRFPFPDAAQREELWRRLLAGGAPVAADIDHRALAQRYELAGGHIRNIVLRAAYAAAGAGCALGMAQLTNAAGREYADRGMLLPKGRMAR